MNNPLDYLRDKVDEIESRYRNLNPNDIDALGMLKIKIAEAELGITMAKERRENLELYADLTKRIGAIKNKI